ncbi:uncharacterized protein LOC135225117 [Macrobrachium nipponense]|uniref:uncharacterized protein LOC135225117 n=1 Tax=Macrobrachium nipponense TaxID=159736 RepID=UPI0030C82501
MSFGDHFLDRTVRLPGKTAPQTSAILPQQELEKEGTKAFRHLPNFSRGQERFKVVAGSSEAGRGSLTSTSEPTANTVLRRTRPRLGSNTGEQRDFGAMKQNRKDMAYQQERADGSFSSSSGIRGVCVRQSSGNKHGQRDCSSVCQETRRHPLLFSERDSQESFAMGKGQKYRPPNEICTGRIECQSGPLEPEKPGPANRMDSQVGGMQNAMEVMEAAFHRLVCDQQDKKDADVLLPGSRPTSSSSRRIPHELGRAGSVRLPSFQSATQSIEEVHAVRRSQNDPDIPVLADPRLVRRDVAVASGSSKNPSVASRSAQTTPLQTVSQEYPHSTANCLSTVEKLLRARGFSREAAKAIARSRRALTINVYQSKWEVFRNWCKEKKVSLSNTSVSQITDFLLHLKLKVDLATTTIKGYRSMLASVFRHRGLDLSRNQDLHDLIRSFDTTKQKSEQLPGWNLDVVLRFLMSGKFEPIQECSFRDLTRKTLFLVALATARRVSEIQGMDKRVGISRSKAVCSTTLGFLAKNKTPTNPWPRSFTIPSLGDFAGQERERTLCPVRALQVYLQRCKDVRGTFDNLWCSVKDPKRLMSKNALAFFIRSVIQEAHIECNETLYKALKVKAHEV